MIWTSLIAQARRQAWMSLLVAIFVGLILVHFTRFYQGNEERGWWVWLLWVLWIPVSLYVLKSALWLIYQIDRQPFRRLDLGLSEDTAPPGGSFQLVLEFETRRRGTIEAIRADLSCVRHWLREGKRVSETLHEEREVLAESLTFEPGARREFDIALRLPEKAPYSYRSMEGKIVWSIRVSVSVSDWETLEEPIDVLVAPV